MLRQPANAGQGTRVNVKVVGQDAQADTRTGHPAGIAHTHRLFDQLRGAHCLAKE
jgi:hypothetical protein